MGGNKELRYISEISLYPFRSKRNSDIPHIVLTDYKSIFSTPDDVLIARFHLIQNNHFENTKLRA